jgi:hypothetical protein
MVLREQHHRHVFTAPGPPATRMSNAQITLFGHSTDSQAHDQLAAQNGAYIARQAPRNANYGA